MLNYGIFGYIQECKQDPKKACFSIEEPPNNLHDGDDNIIIQLDKQLVKAWSIELYKRVDYLLLTASSQQLQALV